MIKTDIFVVNTHLHLILAQCVVAQYRCEHPILLVAEAVDIESSPLLDRSLWCVIAQFPKYGFADLFFLSKIQTVLKRALRVDDSLGRLFLANDYQVENQIIRSYLPNFRVNIYDDGIAFYTMTATDKSPFRVLLRRVVSGVLLPGRIKNVYGLGHTVYEEIFCLFPELNLLSGPKRKINLSIPASLGNKILKKLPNGYRPKQTTAVWLTQPFVEGRALSFEDEILSYELSLQRLVAMGISEIAIKSHPRESSTMRHRRRSWFESNSLGMKVVCIPDVNAPIEAFFGVFKPGVYVSTNSTALLTARICGVESMVACCLPNSLLRKTRVFDDFIELVGNFEIVVWR